MARRSARPYVAVLRAEGSAGGSAVKRTEGLRQALLPETGRRLPGATVRVAAPSRGRGLEIRIEADNLRSLRAALNSTLRLAGLALAVADGALEGGEEE